MPGTPPPSDDLIAAAAKMRADGATWKAIAAALGCGYGTVCKWPALYPYRWSAAVAAVAAARTASPDEAAAEESIHTLRHQLRSEDTAARTKAADLLLRHTAAKRRKRAARTGRPKLSKPLAAVAAELEGMSDDQLDHLLADLARLEADDGPDPNDAAGPPGGG